MGSAASVLSGEDSKDAVSIEQVKEIAGDNFDEAEFRKITGIKGSFVTMDGLRHYLLELELADDNRCKISMEEAKEIVGDKFDEEEFRKMVGSNGCLSMPALQKYLILLEDASDMILNFEALKSLMFASAEGGRGKCLVDIKDTSKACFRIFQKLFQKYASDANGMVVTEFHKFVEASACGLDTNAINAHFYECTKYPDDEDDASEVIGIQADLGKFISAVIRVANAVDIQNNGGSEKSLRDQLVDWLSVCAGALQISRDLLDSSISASSLRDASFFRPPPDFIGTKPKVYLEFESEDLSFKGKVVFELNAEAAPKTAFNFKCLCTGERGVGEVSELPLSYKGNSIHRIVPGMCIQGGDLEEADGMGGESIYGGEFDDENFSIKHDTAGILSMGNSGQNTNTSQFFVTLAASPHLDGENVAFGRVIEGLDFLQTLGSIPVDEDGKPQNNILIKGCGLEA